VDQEESSLATDKDAYCNWQERWPPRSSLHIEERPMIPSKLSERYYVHVNPLGNIVCNFQTGPLAAIDWSSAVKFFRHHVIVELAESAQTHFLEPEFNELVNKWREDIGAESSLTNITGNINYLRIIALGKPVVPLILKELQRQPAPWFVALRAITGELNVGKEYTGNFKKIAEAWVNWCNKNGYNVQVCA
jgi:hypothetical protein